MSNEAIQQSILNKSRKDKFLLVLNLPNALKKISHPYGSRETEAINLDSLQYSIWGTVVPNITIPPVEATFGGQVTNVTSYFRPAYSPIDIKFTVDNWFNNWWVLWKWLDFINDAKQASFNAKEIEDPDEKYTNSYMTMITVYGLDEYNNKKIQFDYTDAFITGLAGISYDYKDSEQMESSFTFSFGQFDSKLL